MTIQQTDPERPDSRPRRFQYSLRTLFVLTTGLAMLCSILFSLPTWLAELAVVFLVISTAAALTVTLIYGRGYVRTFCIGALFPAGVCLLSSTYGLEMIYDVLIAFLRSDDERLVIQIFVTLYYTLVLGDGVLAVCVRRLAEAPDDREPPESRRDEEP